MAVPFRRKSSTRIKKGRAPKSWAFQKKSFSAQPLIKCSNCQEEKVLHQICSNCSTYKGISFEKPVKQQENDKK